MMRADGRARRDDTAEARSVAPATVGRTRKRLLELDAWQFAFIRDSSGNLQKAGTLHLTGRAPDRSRFALKTQSRRPHRASSAEKRT
jgi:hypothetical protein